MIKFFAVQTLVGLSLLSLRVFIIFDFVSFALGFLFAQIYAGFFLYLVGILFKRKKRGSALSIIFFKWIFLFFVLYGLLSFIEPVGFSIGLVSMPSFFIMFAVLRRNQES